MKIYIETIIHSTEWGSNPQNRRVNSHTLVLLRRTENHDGLIHKINVIFNTRYYYETYHSTFRCLRNLNKRPQAPILCKHFYSAYTLVTCECAGYFSKFQTSKHDRCAAHALVHIYKLYKKCKKRKSINALFVFKTTIWLGDKQSQAPFGCMLGMPDVRKTSMLTLISTSKL